MRTETNAAKYEVPDPSEPRAPAADGARSQSPASPVAVLGGKTSPRRALLEGDETAPEQPGLRLIGFLGRRVGVKPQICVRENAVHLEGVSKRFLTMVFGIGFALALSLGILVGALLS